jgi:uncharacterized membrane protein
MFEFLFKYPLSVFEKGTIVLAGSWPRWLLFLLLILVVGGVAAGIWRIREKLRPSLRYRRAFIVGTLQALTLATLLLLLWKPAISVTTLKPQQNIIAVVVDDSRSMGLNDGSSTTREQQAVKLVNDTLTPELAGRFQVRLYKLDAGVDRIGNTQSLQAQAASTQIDRGMKELAAEAGTLPIGGVILLSDGADNRSGVELETLNELKRRRLPVHTVGFGKTQLTNDIEVDDVDIPTKSLPGSLVEARVKIRQAGYSGKHVKLILTGSGSTYAERDIALADAPEQTETIEFNAGKAAGVKTLEVRVEPQPGETNIQNNKLKRVLAIDGTKQRILYVEGEPRWEYKFLRRAIDDDPALQVVSMLRTTQNKIYRQGIANPNDLEDGFPTKPEDLFEYQGLILGSIESAFFSGPQQQMIKDFVDRRGGGAIFLAGRWALSDGGYNIAPFSDLLPVNLPQRKDEFRRDFLAAELTPAGKTSLVCRIEDDAGKSVRHWEILPYLANYQDPGTPKPGALVLANVDSGGKKLPLLITQNYGRGRSGVFATAGSWRWRMQQPVGDTSQEMFWRQLLRWVAGATPSRVVASASNTHLEDDGKVHLHAGVRDTTYLPTGNAEVTAHVVAPDGAAEDISLKPDPLKQGEYSADFDATKSGSYVAEFAATENNKPLGKDILTLQRQDGVAENFHREQNADLLKKLSNETGGRYYTPSDAVNLPREIAYSEAGISSREMKDLWDMPAVFLLLLILKSSEWLLRRKWGVV